MVFAFFAIFIFGGDGGFHEVSLAVHGLRDVIATVAFVSVLEVLVVYDFGLGLCEEICRMGAFFRL